MIPFFSKENVYVRKTIKVKKLVRVYANTIGFATRQNKYRAEIARKLLERKT